eukprot:g1688.t1
MMKEDEMRSEYSDTLLADVAAAYVNSHVHSIAESEQVPEAEPPLPPPMQPPQEEEEGFYEVPLAAAAFAVHEVQELPRSEEPPPRKGGCAKCKACLLGCCCCKTTKTQDEDASGSPTLRANTTKLLEEEIEDFSGPAIISCVAWISHRGLAKMPLCCVIVGIVVSLLIIGVGMVASPVEVEIDWDSFLKTDVNTSTMRDVFLFALQHRSVEGRRLSEGRQLQGRNRTSGTPLRAFRTAFRFKWFCCTSLQSGPEQGRVLDEMRKTWDEFLDKAVIPLLREESQKSSSLNVFYTGSTLYGKEVTSTLLGDLVLAGGSITFVLVYLILHTHSILLGVMGLLIIVGAIPISYVVFAVVTGSNKMSIASFLSVFLIVGLGSDVVFVYTDFWADSRSRKENYGSRMTYPNVSRYARAIQKFRRSICLCPAILSLAFIGWAVSVLQVDSGVPSIFPEDHNLNRGAEVFGGLFYDTSQVFNPLWMIGRPEVAVCNDELFTPVSGSYNLGSWAYNCNLNWCEANPDIDQSEDGTCHCWRRELESTCDRSYATASTKIIARRKLSEDDEGAVADYFESVDGISMSAIQRQGLQRTSAAIRFPPIVTEERREFVPMSNDGVRTWTSGVGTWSD